MFYGAWLGVYEVTGKLKKERVFLENVLRGKNRWYAVFVAEHIKVLGEKDIKVLIHINTKQKFDNGIPM